MEPLLNVIGGIHLARLVLTCSLKLLQELAREAIDVARLAREHVRVCCGVVKQVRSLIAEPADGNGQLPRLAVPDADSEPGSEI